MTQKIAAHKKPLVSDIAKQLNTRDTEVITALEYWQNKGLLTIKNHEQTWVLLTHDADSGQKNARALYTDKDYNNTLQQLFGTHILKISEYELIYDWTDIYKLPKEVAMMVVEYSIGRKGRNVNIKYMDAVAKSWAEKGIDSVENAMHEIDRHERIGSGANRVLKYIGGTGRLPSKPEMLLYAKWTDDWGFTQDAIMMALDDLSSTTNPSFKYIDSVLKSLKEKGAVTSRRVSETKATQTKIRGQAKELLDMLGQRLSTPNLNKIAAFKQMGFSQPVLKLAFAEGAKRQTPSLAYVKTVLESWQAQGLSTKPKIMEYLANRNDLRQNAYALFKKAGVTKALNTAYYKAYVTWTSEDGFETQLLDEVAQMSKTANNPFSYMTKVLANLKEKQVTTLAAFNSKNGQQINKDKGYLEREYSSENFQRDLDELDIDVESDT